MRRRRSHLADDVHDHEHIDVDDRDDRYVDHGYLHHHHGHVDHGYVDLHHGYVDDDHDLAAAGGLSLRSPGAGPRRRPVHGRGVQWSAAVMCFLGALALAPSLHAQTVRLQTTLTVQRSPETVRISALVQNRGRNPAYELQAELRSVDVRPRAMVGELAPGGRTGIAWELEPELWRTELKEIAALRIRYHDAAGTWASSVTVNGRRADAVVQEPAWPDDPRIQVAWRDSGAGDAVWWSPAELQVSGGGRWRAETGTAAIEGRVQPATDITGWETNVFLLVLPDDPGSPGRIVPVRVDARSFRALWRPDPPLLAGWAILCLAAWLAGAALVRGKEGAARRPAAERLRETLPAFATAACLGTAGLMLLPPRLLLLDTTPAGGDYASHIVALDQLREVLLPSGRVFGWSMDQYGGFPLFLFYFPLAFLVIVLLSALLPLTVAMKVGSLAGALLLPLAWHRALGWLGAPRAARWLAPAAALAFLLIETHATWGGNLPSLLAGEFAYGLGLPLAWLAVTHAWKTRDDTRGWWPAAVLLALAGLAHGYALVAAALGMALLALHPRQWWRRLWHVARIGLTAFGLLAWWLVPLIANLPWTNGFRESWEIGGVRDLFPSAVLVAGAILLAGAVARLISRRRPVLAPGQLWLLAFAALLFAVYKLGYSLGVVDVRFLPIMHGAVLLAGCFELGGWITAAAPARRPVLLAASIAVVTAGAVLGVRYIPSWVRWNMQGMERTSRWEDYRGVVEALAGSIDEPRVAYEHHPDHSAAGTVRAFELLPWFADRATLEGLYFQSAVLAPAVFYLQSETSLRPSCPLPAYECGRFDPARAAAHLRLLGVRELVAYTDSLTRSLGILPGFEVRERSGVYTVFDLGGPAPLVEPVRLRPVVDEWPDWRREAYDWFRAAADLDVPLVLRGAGESGWPSVDRYRPRRLPRVPYASRPAVRATVQDQAIRIETERPGHPLLVKVGYHPGWRASDGSAIELVAPGMMLVTPRTDSLTLEWASRWPGQIGLLVTALTALALAVAGRRRQRPRGPAAHWLPDAGRAGWIGIVALGVLSSAAVLVMLRRHPPYDFPALLAEGQRRMSDGRYVEADASFRRMLSVETPHGYRDDAAMYRAIVAQEAGDPEEARERLASFLVDFPVSTYRAEALVRMADLEMARGETGRARTALEEARVAPLAPRHWLAAARDRLERLDAAMPPGASGDEDAP